MATIASVNTNLNNAFDKGHLTQWTPLTFSGLDVGAVMEQFGEADRSVQVVGTFGVGGTVLIEGSNDGTNFSTLKDHLGVALSITTSGILSVDQIVRYLRPRVTAGDGTTSLTITVLSRRVAP